MTQRRLAIAVAGLLGAVAIVVALLAFPRTGTDLAAPLPPSASAPDGSASFERDWQAALAEAQAGDDNALRDVAARWLWWQGEETMNAVMRLRGRSVRKVWALSLWLEANPDDALGWVGRLPAARRDRVLAAAFAEFAGRDPAAAVDAAGRLKNPDRRVGAAAAALRVWARADPAGAWRAAQEVDIGFIPWTAVAAERRGKLSLAVLDVWVLGGWRAPLDAVEASAEPHVPRAWMNAALTDWVAAAPQDALAWASSLAPRDGGERTPSSRPQELGATWAAMAIHWPHQANAAVEAVGDFGNRHRQNIYNTGAYQDVIRSFVEAAEPRRVAAWFDSHPDELMRRQHEDDVARAYASAHPDEALRWARALPLGQRADAVWAALNVIGGEAPPRVARMLLALGDEELLNDCADRVITAWTKVDPVAALGWADIHAPEEWTVERRMDMFQLWAWHDPVAAAAHLPNIADPVAKAWATRNAINGTFFGVKRRPGGKRNIHEHIPMIERLYAELPPAQRSKHVAYFLYRHFQLRDPQRAAEYKAEAGDDHGDPWNFN